MTKQLNILDAIAEGERLAQIGLQLAIDHAEGVAPGWKDRAWKQFVIWLSEQPHRHLFKIEDFRIHCQLNDLLENPPSSRAFGFLPLKAVKEELIQKVGYTKVTNKKAHATPCSLWRVVG